MNSALLWTKFEAVMTAVLAVKAITMPKINSFEQNRIRYLENSSTIRNE